MTEVALLLLIILIAVLWALFEQSRAYGFITRGMEELQQHADEEYAKYLELCRNYDIVAAQYNDVLKRYAALIRTLQEHAQDNPECAIAILAEHEREFVEDIIANKGLQS